MVIVFRSAQVKIPPDFSDRLKVLVDKADKVDVMVDQVDAHGKPLHVMVFDHATGEKVGDDKISSASAEAWEKLKEKMANGDKVVPDAEADKDGADQHKDHVTAVTKDHVAATSKDHVTADHKDADITDHDKDADTHNVAKDADSAAQADDTTEAEKKAKEAKDHATDDVKGKSPDDEVESKSDAKKAHDAAAEKAKEKAAEDTAAEIKKKAADADQAKQNTVAAAILKGDNHDNISGGDTLDKSQVHHPEAKPSPPPIELPSLVHDAVPGKPGSPYYTLAMPEKLSVLGKTHLEDGSIDNLHYRHMDAISKDDTVIWTGVHGWAMGELRDHMPENCAVSHSVVPGDGDPEPGYKHGADGQWVINVINISITCEHPHSQVELELNGQSPISYKSVSENPPAWAEKLIKEFNAKGR